jgi:hypothetical protein
LANGKYNDSNSKKVVRDWGYILYTLFHRKHLRAKDLDCVTSVFSFNDTYRRGVGQKDLSRRQKYEFPLCIVILLCDEAENIRRMKTDGHDEERIMRGIKNTRGIYDM